MEPWQPCRRNNGSLREHCVYVFGTELTTPCLLLAHPPMMGHVSCRHMESVICGELHCLTADGGASAQLGARQAHKKAATRVMEFGWQRGRIGKTLGCHPTVGTPCQEAGFSELWRAALHPQHPLVGWCQKKGWVAQLCTPMVV